MSFQADETITGRSSERVHVLLSAVRPAESPHSQTVESNKGAASVSLFRAELRWIRCLDYCDLASFVHGNTQRQSPKKCTVVNAERHGTVPGIVCRVLPTHRASVSLRGAARGTKRDDLEQVRNILLNRTDERRNNRSAAKQIRSSPHSLLA